MKRIFLFLLLATVARGATYDYPVKTATNALSASKALTTDANGKAAASATTSTEIGYVSGVTSAIQTQIDAKLAATNGTASGGTFTGATNISQIIIDASAWDQSSGYGIYGGSPQAFVGAGNASAHLMLTAGAKLTGNPASANGFTAYNSAAAGSGVASMIRMGRSGNLEVFSASGLTNATTFTWDQNGTVGRIANFNTNGIKVARGTNSTPAFSFDDDTDSGLYSSGANVVSIATGGTERFRVDGSGHLGVNTTAPNSDGYNGPVLALNTSASGNTAFILKQNNTTRGSYRVETDGSVTCRAETGSPLYLMTINSQLVFSPGITEKARFTSAGNFGIGATSPQYLLDLNGQSRIIGTNGMRFGGTSGATDDTVTIWQPSANVARITASSRTEVTGPMMIGSTGSPAGHVEVIGANNSTSLLVMGSPGTSTVDTLQIKQGGSLKFSVTKDSSLAQPGTITTPGTTGAQTINKPLGTVNLAAGATSLVVTDSVCLSATNCIVFGQVLSDDTTCKSVAIVVGTGSFTIYPNAAPTAETVVAFQVLKIQ